MKLARRTLVAAVVAGSLLLTAFAFVGYYGYVFDAPAYQTEHNRARFVRLIVRMEEEGASHEEINLAVHQLETREGAPGLTEEEREDVLQRLVESRGWQIRLRLSLSARRDRDDPHWRYREFRDAAIAEGGRAAWVARLNGWRADDMVAPMLYELSPSDEEHSERLDELWSEFGMRLFFDVMRVEHEFRSIRVRELQAWAAQTIGREQESIALGDEVMELLLSMDPHGDRPHRDLLELDQHLCVEEDSPIYALVRYEGEEEVDRTRFVLESELLHRGEPDQAAIEEAAGSLSEILGEVEPSD